MSRTEHFSYSRWYRSAATGVENGSGIRSFVIAALLIAAIPHSAAAHSILLSRGTAVVHRDRVLVEIEINARDFVHYGYLQPVSSGLTVSAIRGAAEQHRLHLLQYFIIRDEAGVRMDGALLKIKWNGPPAAAINHRNLGNYRVTYTIEYPTRKPPRYLTFQQVFGGAHAPVPVQLVLGIQSVEHEKTRLIQLTNRGNVETLQFTWADPPRTRSGIAHVLTSEKRANRPDSALRPDRFKSISAFLRIDDKTVQCDISIPLVLLETWQPVPRNCRDFVEPEEMTAAIERLPPFFINRLPLHINGEPVAPDQFRIALLGPDDRSIDDASQRRCGAWSARVGVRLAFRKETPVNHVLLAWKLFNSAVFSARVTTVSHEARSEQQVTPYHPNVTWHRFPVPASRRAGLSRDVCTPERATEQRPGRNPG